MTDEQMDTIKAQFDEMRGQFAEVLGQSDAMRGRFDAMRGQFDEMRGRFKAIDKRFDGVDSRLTNVERRLTNVEGELTSNGRTLEGLDTRVHQLGLLQEEQRRDLKLFAEQFVMLQRIGNAKIELQGDTFERRVDPLEYASRHHAAELERHDRRLTTLEAPPATDNTGEQTAS